MGRGSRRFILYQYYQAYVTRGVLLAQLRNWGVDISTGQLERILTENQDPWHAGKDALLATGLDVSKQVTVDDTGARHQGQNGYTSRIGNAYFACFQTTERKDRLNFLQLLHGDQARYVINDAARGYVCEHKRPQAPLTALENAPCRVFPDKPRWEEHLRALGIDKARHVRVATEGALVGGLYDKGWRRASRSSATRPVSSMCSRVAFAGGMPNASCTSSSRLGHFGIRVFLLCRPNDDVPFGQK
nr:hypothetical protein [Gammaproteobacteria bacterium]